MLEWLDDMLFGPSRSQLRRINDETRRERDRLAAEVARLTSLMDNARNQLDGRKAYPGPTEPACVGA